MEQPARPSATPPSGGSSESPRLEARLGRRLVVVLTAGGLGIAAIGLTAGISANARVEAPALPPMRGAPVGVARPAPHYADLVAAPLGPNADFQSTLESLRQPPPATPPARPDPAARVAALAARAERRAYDGAPPVIPHPVDPRGAEASCLACHGDGLVAGETVARRMPHPAWTMCTQCHVERGGPRDDAPPPGRNTFVGMIGPAFAHRAAPGLPPVTPHPITLRQDCLSCHGPLGLRGLQTSHPERQSCLQCHPAAGALLFPATRGRTTPFDGLANEPPESP